jgi:hypothetical protein
VPRLEAARLRALVADLDGDDFSVREKASGELRNMQELAGPALRAALGGQPSAELRRRAEELLAHVEGRADEQSGGRVLEVLERFGTPEAKRLLEELAAGDPGARQTQEASAALRRLEVRSPER